MYPSFLRTSRTRARSFEPGVETVPRRRSCALRMRVSISPNGSLIIECPPLPARLHEARNQPLGAEFAQRDARHAELAVIGPRTARHLATVADAGGVRVARQFGQLEARLEALLHGLRLVVRNRQQALAAARVFLHELATELVLLNSAFLSHAFISSVRV